MEGISFIMEVTIFKTVTYEGHWLNTNDSLLLATQLMDEDCDLLKNRQMEGYLG